MRSWRSKLRVARHTEASVASQVNIRGTASSVAHQFHRFTVRAHVNNGDRDVQALPMNGAPAITETIYAVRMDSAAIRINAVSTCWSYVLDIGRLIVIP